MLYPPFKNLHSSVCPSVRPSIRPSVSALFQLSARCIFQPIFFKLGIRVILGRSVLGLQMGKFRQISTELWPLIEVRNCFFFSIFGISLPIFFKLCMRVDIGKECLGIEDG